MSKPISPREAEKRAVVELPPEVFEAFNEMITANLRNGVARFKLKEVADLIASKLKIDRGEVYKRNLCDVEQAYRDHGWEVVYDAPSMHDNYEENFTFRTCWKRPR